MNPRQSNAYPSILQYFPRKTLPVSCVFGQLPFWVDSWMTLDILALTKGHA